ncbi:MAG: acyl-CoA desaturase [Pyrinomonadaceae bacterium]|nr:acyl-CoA desaturase [Phycisphaerales bacterium]
MPSTSSVSSAGSSVLSATRVEAPVVTDEDPRIAPCLAEAQPAQASPRILTPVEKRLRVVNLIAVLAPIAGLAVAITLAWGTAFNWTQFWILVGMTYATSVGITVGYHRLFTHQSFKTNKVVRYLLAVLGSMAVQGAVIEWCGAHRKHHQHSDEDGDPHSPHCHDGVEWDGGGGWASGLKATLRGFYHSHVGWLFETRLKGMGKYTPDLRADPVVRAANSQFYYWALIGLLIPTALGGLLTWSIVGALEGLLWGGFVRILLVHHITWSVNSVCHLWGTSPFRTGDKSRNNAIVGVLALGEGWHNNHHAFPASARHGLRWWQFDPSYILIRGLWLVGLATNVRVPDSDRVKAKRK